MMLSTFQAEVGSGLNASKQKVGAQTNMQADTQIGHLYT